MPRGMFDIKVTGLQEFIKELKNIEANYSEIMLESLKAQEQVVETKIRQNWTTMTGGRTGDYVHDSVGSSAVFSKQSDNTVLGTVGVYHMDAVAAAHDKTDKDLNAAQIAYWVEFGTSGLRGGGRKKKGVTYNEEDLITVSPRPFISNAFYQTLDEQMDAFKARFNELMDKQR